MKNKNGEKLLGWGQTCATGVPFLMDLEGIQSYALGLRQAAVLRYMVVGHGHQIRKDLI